jgi:uncharacterized protein (TIGR03435 family)
MILARFRTSFALLVTLTFIPTLRAQLIVPGKSETLPTFEVATVKPSSRDLGRSFHVHIWRNDNTYRTENTTLRDLIRAAFNTSSNAQLVGGFDSLLDSRWDINAKIGDDDYTHLKTLPRDEQVRALHLMLQALLADRFGLRFHIETRELPVFNLVIDKGGSKLQPSAPETSTASSAAANPHDSPASAPVKPRNPGVSTSVNHDQGRMIATDATPFALTTMLGHQPELDGRAVIDKTRLTGKYDWTLEWHPLTMNSTDTDATGPSLFSALKDQLGLRLEPSKGPVQIVVVDAASTPTPN